MLVQEDSIRGDTDQTYEMRSILQGRSSKAIEAVPFERNLGLRSRRSKEFDEKDDRLVYNAHNLSL
jgi:hypothetical protein